MNKEEENKVDQNKFTIILDEIDVKITLE